MPRRADLTWQMKLAIWDLTAKLGPKPTAIQRSLDRIREAGDLKEDVPDVRTISAVIEELQQLEPSVVRILPEHVQRLRIDYAKLGLQTPGQPSPPGGADARTMQAHRQNLMPMPEDPAQAERSGHWPALRRMAQDIGNGLFRVYFSQMVGLPWERSQLVNTATGQAPTLELPPDKHDFYRALQEHLPRHLVWETVNAWLASIPAVLATAAALKGWVGQQPEYGRLSNRGDGFASMLVYEAAEDPCGLPTSAFEWQPRGTVAPSEAWTLQRFRNGSQYADMATGTEPQALEQARASYEGLKARMGGLDKLRVLAEAWNSLARYELELRRLFTTIAQLARFEGICHLWTG